MKNITIKAIVIGIIAGLIVLLDKTITLLINQTASFAWVAFVSWTVFYSSTVKERLKAILGYIIGFLAAVAIIKLGVVFSIIGVILGSILATVIINYLCIELERISKFFPYSVSGIFVGLSITFSGLGIGLTTNTLKEAATMLTLIIVYGIIGLLAGWLTQKFTPQTKLTKQNTYDNLIKEKEV